jgi:GT2 family glycosyltransferase
MRLSVVMSVYNNAPFIERAVNSILQQTWRDFEFVIINDGSTDGSTEILRRLAASDIRIKLVEQENRGLVASLNRGFAMAAGGLIARMDGDDESLPERFERQVAFLDKHRDHGVVGAQTVNIDQHGTVVRRTDNYPRSFEQFLDAMDGKPLINHPSVIIDRSVFERANGYRSLYRHCEDYDLWLRLSEFTKLCSLDEILHRYRVNDDQVTIRHLLHVEIGAAIAWEAHQERQHGRPDPTAALSSLPRADRLDELDALFGVPGVARRVRAKVAPKLLYSPEALAEGGVELLCQYVADGGERQPVTRTVARLVRTGRVGLASRLAAGLSRTYFSRAA